MLQFCRTFDILKRRFPVLITKMSIDSISTEILFVTCVILHNITIDVHDEIPNDGYGVDRDNDVEKDHNSNKAEVTRGSEERSKLINDYFLPLTMQ